MHQEPPIGSVVVVRDARLAEQIGRVDQRGLVVHRRRGGARVVFFPDRAAFWIDDPRLWIVAAEPGSLLERAGRALTMIAPEESEIEELADGELEFSALSTGMTRAELRALEAELGDALVEFAVLPYGMAFLTVRARLRGG